MRLLKPFEIPGRSLVRAAARACMGLFHADATAREPSSPHLILGRAGEELAADLLRAKGYRLVASNFKIQVGRDLRGAPVTAELDLVAYDGATLCFIEVKTRASDRFAPPEANVDLRKQRQITRGARAYRRALGIPRNAPYRFDVVSVIIPPPDESDCASPPRVELLRNFWSADKFRPRRRCD